MRIDKRIKILALTIAFVALVTSASGQDLGSANKLFGAGSKKKVPPAQARTANQPKTSAETIAAARMMRVFVLLDSMIFMLSATFS